MSNPLTSAGGGMAKKIMQQQMQQMQKMQQTTPQNQPGKAGGGGVSDFQKNFSNKVNQTNNSQKIQADVKVNQQKKVNFNRSNQVNKTDKTAKSDMNKLNANKGNSVQQKLSGFLDGLNNRKKTVDGMMDKALKGKVFNNREMLKLQYEVSLFSLEMDLTSKVVDKVTGGIKQVMQTQV
jgi:flagellar hook-basal body complex protein FliE